MPARTLSTPFVDVTDVLAASVLALVEPLGEELAVVLAPELLVVDPDTVDEAVPEVDPVVATVADESVPVVEDDTAADEAVDVMVASVVLEAAAVDVEEPEAVEEAADAEALLGTALTGERMSNCGV